MEQEFIHFLFWFFVIFWVLGTAIIVFSRVDGYPDNDDLPGMKAANRRRNKAKRKE